MDASIELFLILFGFGILYIIMFFVFCSSPERIYYYYPVITKRTEPPTGQNVELGLENTQQDASVPEDGLTSTSTVYRRITEPEIKNGKLYGQDYFAIKDRLDRTQSLFLDDKVCISLYQSVSVSVLFLYLLFSSLRTNTLSATMAR